MNETTFLPAGVAEAVKARRSVKVFDPDHRMSAEELRHLMEHAILSPTAFNLQHWRFVQVTDPGLRQQIRAAAWDQPQVTDASLLLVIGLDVKAWEKDPARYWRSAPADVQTFVVNAIGEFYRGREQVQRDEAMRSCGLVAQTLMLMAKDMGYDSSPMVGFDFDAVARLIDLPQDHVIGMMLAVGKPLRGPWPRGGQLPLEEVLFTDRFGVA